MTNLNCFCHRWTVEAFKGSIKAGNDDVVNYFLHNFQTFIDQSLKVQCHVYTSHALYTKTVSAINTYTL